MLFKDKYEHLPDHVISQSLGNLCYGIKGMFSTFRLKNSTFWEIKATLKNEIRIECPSEVTVTHHYLLIIKSTQLIKVKLTEEWKVSKNTTEVQANEMIVYIDSKVNIQLHIPAETQLHLQVFATSKKELLTRIDADSKLKFNNIINAKAPIQYIIVDEPSVVKSLFAPRKKAINCINQVVKRISSVMEVITQMNNLS